MTLKPVGALTATVVALLLALAQPGLAARRAAAVQPHILAIMVDDLGSYDTRVSNPDAPSPTIGQLADAGVRLDRHYVYMYCSPTRRSFLAGRFATRINPLQANTCDNFLPLQFTLLPQKLERAGYTSHFIGKGHLGYPTTDHLPVRRGYASHVGYLGGAEAYDQSHNSHDFWHNDRPANASLLAQVWYSTNYYTQYATDVIQAHDPAVPLFLDLRYQGVHGPYVEPPVWEQVANSSSNNFLCGPTYSCQIMESMVSVVDSGIANVTAALKAKGMWNDTLVVFFADNGGGMGGTEPSNNYPLRGTKGQPWDGGVRVSAFVSGGVVPPQRRGTNTSAFISVADWYPTLLGLAGVSPEDIRDDVNYSGAVRSLDGIDAWPVLMGEADSLGREWLPTTNQSIVWNSTWKLITGAPSTHWFSPQDAHTPDGWECRGTGPANVSTRGVWVCEVCTDAEPCLFNLVEDPEERNDVAKLHPDIVAAARAAMPGLNFPPYTGSDLLPSEAANYYCRSAQQARKEFWGGMEGPCCHPRQPGPWPPAPPPGPAPGPAPPTPRPQPGLHSNWDLAHLNFTRNPTTGALELPLGGWAWNGSFPGHGVPPVHMQVVADGRVVSRVTASVARPDLPVRTGAPNKQHGFSLVLVGEGAEVLAGAGEHHLAIAAGDAVHLADCTSWTPIRGSPQLFRDGRHVNGTGRRP